MFIDVHSTMLILHLETELFRLYIVYFISCSHDFVFSKPSDEFANYRVWTGRRISILLQDTMSSVYILKRDIINAQSCKRLYTKRCRHIRRFFVVNWWHPNYLNIVLIAVWLNWFNGFIYFIAASTNFVESCSDFLNIASSISFRNASRSSYCLLTNSIASLWSFDMPRCWSTTAGFVLVCEVIFWLTSFNWAFNSSISERSPCLLPLILLLCQALWLSDFNV